MTSKDPAESGPYPHLTFIVNELLIAQFFLLLQQGVRIRRRVGCTVDAFLRTEIGAGPGTIEKIQSLMLDGKPVDDIGSALVHDGSILALSAAMPGLVGATLRRGGSYSAFRSAITYHETNKACATGEGWVVIKVFNLLMADMGPGLLEAGVLLESGDLLSFLAEREQAFREGCSATLDGRPVDIAHLRDDAQLRAGGRVLLIVSSGQTAA